MRFSILYRFSISPEIKNNWNIFKINTVFNLILSHNLEQEGN